MKKHIVILAITIFFFQLDINSQTYDKDTELASNYYSTAVNYKNKFKLDSSKLFFTKASRLFKKHKVWDNYLIIENEIGVIYLRKGKIKKTLSHFKRITPVALKEFGDTSEYLSNIYNNVGLAYFMSGKNDKAIEFLQQSLNLRIAVSGNENVFVSNIYNDLGNTYTEMAEYDKALEYYQLSLSLRKKILGNTHPEIAVSLNNIGIIYKEKGEYDIALEYHQNAIKMQKGIFGDVHPELANFYQGIGNVYLDKLEIDLAMEYFLKTLDIRKKIYGTKHPLVAKDYINVGITHHENGNDDIALEYYLDALNIQKRNLGNLHPSMAILYNNIGNIYNSQEQYSFALAFYKKALKIKENMYGENHPEIADYYNNIGNIYASQKKYTKALEFHTKALTIKERFFGRKHPGIVLPFLNLANVYYSQNDFENAINYYQKSLSANVKDFTPDETDNNSNPAIKNYYDANKLLLSLRGKAKSFVGLYKKKNNINNLKSAFHLYLLNDSLIGKIRKSISSKKDKLAIGKLSSQIYDEAIDVCYMLNQEEKNASINYVYQAFYFSEKNKAGTLLDALNGAKAKKFAGIPDSLINKEKKIKEEITFYENKIIDEYDPELETKYRGVLFKLNRQYARLINKFETEYKQYYETKHSSKYVTVSQLQSLIDNKTAIRSYFVGDSLIVIFTLTKKGLDLDKVVKVKEFSDKISDFRMHMKSSSYKKLVKYGKEAYNYYNLLFPKELPDGIENIIIIPDGNLGMIPFEALFTEKYKGKITDFYKYPYLIKKYNISYTYSANLFYGTFKKDSTQTRQFTKDWVGIAPVFDGVKNLIINDFYITPLPASKTEIDTIDSKFKTKNYNSLIKFREKANESFIKSDIIEQIKYLHIATHGYVNSDKPELSCVFLSNKEDQDNDGVLYSGEIFNIELKTDLVVLSACETGLGKIQKGEGIIGLTRALLYAGTKNIIVSLWKVADNSTSKLMIDFYDDILNIPKSNDIIDFSKSLRNTKLKMIENKKFAAPFYWSPFILIGK